MSPIILPDTSSAEDMDVSIAGTYAAEIVKTDSIITEKAKVQQAVIQFQLHGVPDEKENKPRDIKRSAFLNITGVGSMGWDKLLRCCGFEEIADRYRAGEKVPFDTDDLLTTRTGKRVFVILKPSEYQGRRRDNVDSFLPMGG